MKISLRNYIFIIFIFISLLLIIPVNILIYFASEEQLTEEKLKDFETVIKMVTNYLDIFIDENYRDIDFLISNYVNSSKRKISEIEQFLTSKSRIKYVLFLDRDNIVRDVIPYREDIIGIDLSKTNFVKSDLKLKFYGPYISIIDKKPYYVISKPLSDKKVLALINIPGINLLIETLEQQGFYAFIVDDRGLALAHIDEEVVNQGLNLTHYKFVQEGIKGKETLLKGEIEGVKYVFLARKIPQTNYTFFVGNKVTEALSSFYSLEKRLLYIIIVVFAFALLIGLVFSKRFSKPIKNLTEMIEKIKRGEYQIAKYSSDIKELDSISKAIFDMSQTIADREIKLRKIFEASKDAIVISNFEGQILDLNDSAAKMFGFKDKNEVLSNLKIDKTYYHNASDRDFIFKELEEKGFIENFEVLFRKKDGTLFYGLISSSLVKDEEGKVLFILSIVKDITEKRKLQEQLFQAQKMESIGRLAGSVAHDFNNILSVIYSSNQLIQMYAKNDTKIEKYTSSISKGVEKARDFIRKLLTFSKRQPFVAKVYDINEILKEEIKLLKPTIREDIILDFKSSDNPLFVNLDRTQFTQIILNLTVNAMDAMPNGGKIIIYTEEKSFEYEHIKNYPYVKEGSFACINFSDTGIGIPDEIMDRIFEPFFTTKPEGTGLGLATVYSIVHQHNGFINVYSEQGKGTTFRIYLPLVKDYMHEIEKEDKNIEIKIRKILLVEDNNEVKEAIEDLLKNNGFEVCSFSDGLHALDYYRENKDMIDLCLFDIIMPSIGGFELYKKVKEINPQVKVIFMTGYADNLSQFENIIKERQQIITKPFSITELKKKIVEIF